MNTTLKRAASAAVALALAVVTQAQVEFQTVTPQGDTLFCTVTDSAMHHVSIRADRKIQWDIPYIHCSDTLVIPATVEHDGEQYTVTALADSAFYWHGEIISVALPASLTSIGQASFKSTGIFELDVPINVESIGYHAFFPMGNVIYHGSADGSPWGARTVNGYEEAGVIYADSSRTAVTACRLDVVQASLPTSVRTIGSYAFWEVPLTSITLPEGLETIGSSAFQLCEQLGSIVIPSTVTEIGSYAFYFAFRESGEAKVTFADAPCSIGRGAFYYSNFSAIDLGSRVTSIGIDAFASLGRADSVIVPNSCTYLAPRAFCYNYFNRLRKIHLPEGLDSIRDELLHGCTELQEVNIPQSVVYIGEMALAELYRLTELTLPAGLTHIGSWGLGDCSRIGEMHSLAAVPPQVCDNTFDGMNAWLNLTVPCGSAAAYNADPYWCYFQIIDEDCDGIEEVSAEEPKATLTSDGIRVDACNGRVRLIDAGGRLLCNLPCRGTCTLPRPPAGVYLLQTEGHPAIKVVVP